jgi:hypothetical protein
MFGKQGCNIYRMKLEREILHIETKRMENN